ncbi:PPIC-type PPIASE domain protein [Bacteriovorax sp. BSW11_IV]|uniref:peptidylprolyl isomerase n=1 Tax=Bacteriovorax sp. BSW11_IV TaxID=1353529 RepID=UPI00038A0E9B|nr:peptidylprolyl isomerase [Bacteriovorax sp. BSW11_IV]EQC45951.1 PPIC-type PPIASE domain protein [Bacteriovorax sp. BSW11_IV]
MSDNFQKKTSSILVNLIIGLIVIAFVVSGLTTFQGTTPDSVAKVGSYPVKLFEFENEVQRQSQFMSNFINGGKPLTSGQMKQFNVQQNALQNLINSKLILTFADEIGATASQDEIKNQIKSMKFFETNGQFDINKYKGLLAYNRITPEQFEEDTENQIKVQKAQALLASVPVSETYAKEVARIKSEGLSADIMTISKDSLRKTVDVSKKEISEYLANETNAKRVENLFADRKAALDTPEQVKASHILIEVKDGDDKKAFEKIQSIAKGLTVKNFVANVNKFSEEPGAKDRKGSLGWFGRGRMVPEFEKVAFEMKPGQISAPVKTQFGYHLILVEDKKAAKPATLAEHQTDLAKELIQKEKDISALLEKVKTEVASALEKGNKKQLMALEKEYAVNHEEKVAITRLDSANSIQSLSDENLEALFANGVQTNKIYTFDSASKVVVVKTAQMDKKEVKADGEALSRVLSRVLQQNAIKEQKEKVSVKINGNISFQ